MKKVRVSTKAANQKKSGTKTRFKLWHKIALTIVTFVIVVGAALWLLIPSAQNVATFKVNASIPQPVYFLDNNSMIFANSDSLPEINNNRQISTPQPLIISYDLQTGPYTPVFKSNLTSPDLVNKIKISPFIKGTWYLRGNSALMFSPDQDWAADTRFTVTIDKELFNSDVKPDSYRASFTTPKITSEIESFAVYSNPAQPKSMIGVAVISFNYPIDTKNLADRISLKIDGKKLDFTVKTDRFDRTVFITSAPVNISDAAQAMRLKLNSVPALYGDGSSKKITADATIESADNFFKISDISTVAVNDNDGNAQQLILLNTTVATAHNIKLAEFIDVYLLPQYNTDAKSDDENSYTWKSDEITESVLQKSKKLPIKQIEFENPNGVYQYAFSYDVSEQSDRYIYVAVKSGIKSTGGFVLKNSVDKVMRVPYPNAEVKIAGTGALLSLAGDKKLGIMARGGVKNAYVNLYKVKSDEINHLISQTYNVFAEDMQFKSWSFGVYDMSVVFQKTISFANSSRKQTNYASVDLGNYIDDSQSDKTGIFIVQTGTSKNQAEYNDKRLILLTDLGIIRKQNLDETSDLFISNLSDGTPAADVEISVLGRNGNAIWKSITDINGHVSVPKFAWSEYRNAKEPIAFVARRGNDVSFIPYSNAYNQHVEYSKFDVDGTYASATTPMTAYIFSDRGIYRPSENATIGGIVKSKSFKSLAGVPVKLEITDARNRTTLEKTFSLARDGLFDAEYHIPDNAPIGDYQVRVYSLNSKSKPQDMLGIATFRVEEFVPDTLKITATIKNKSDNGWISPENLTANISLRNLFGTPAQNRKISANATLRPIEFVFPEYKKYTFTPNFISNTGLADNSATRAQTFTQTLPDVKTDDFGNAKIDITFDRPVPSGTYMLSLNIRGFEGDSGKSVQTNISARVSDAKYLIGFYANSDLSYVNRDASRSVNIIALDHTANPIAANGLKLRLVKRENLTSLIKDYNNYYKYQTITRDKIISQEKFDIPVTGTDVKLDTQNGGTYFLQVIDSGDKILANIEYYVAASENAQLLSDTNAELQIKLDKSEYSAGDTATVSITAPYVGTGLITIERDKVYAYKWFTTDTTSSVQQIKIPQNFEGSGYINVSFVRDINSRDIFTTPYTYAVAPFAANNSNRKIDIKLSTPETTDTNKLVVKYETNKAARLMIFAVNTGILQVAKYQIPNPLSYFFQKSALQVETYQILSLLLPEYKILREFAKTGGGDYGNADEIESILTNPFARKTLPPVAFYSGIINTVANKQNQITFDIPEYFNGEITVFAIAANDSAVGSANTKTAVQSPVIISATAPVVAAPNDKFEINAVISNMTPTSGANATVIANATTSDNISVIGNSRTDIKIPENTEKLWTFTARASEKLGNADIKIYANVMSENGTELSHKMTTNTLSIRPITAFETNIKTGLIKSKTEKIKKFHIDMYPEYSTRKLYLAQNAAVLTRPLVEYLNHYEYPCTEQLVSKTLPYVLMPENQLIGTTYNASVEKISDAINTLKNRQNDDGSFDLWSGGYTQSRDNMSNADTAFITSYVVQFLTLALQNGFTVPQNMLSRAIDFLRTYAGEPIANPTDAASHAFAIYVITTNDYVTTSYIDIFEEYANANIKKWESELMGAYIASAYKLLKQDDKAESIIKKYKLSETGKFNYESDFNNNVANDAIFHYLESKYFDTQSVADESVREYINSGNYTSYTSAMVILGFGAKSEPASEIINSVSVFADNAQINLESVSDMKIAAIPDTAQNIEIKCDKCASDNTIFYTLLQQGYPTKSTEKSNGIEIVREYYDASGNQITHGNVGDNVMVKIFARARGGADRVSNVAIVDMLPAGFIVDADTITGNMEFSEIREDRVLIYTTLTRNESVFTYTAQLGNAGEFQIPPIAAQSMYNSQINAVGNVGTFTVSNATEK